MKKFILLYTLVAYLAVGGGLSPDYGCCYAVANASVFLACINNGVNTCTMQQYDNIYDAAKDSCIATLQENKMTCSGGLPAAN